MISNFLYENLHYILASILFFIGYWCKGNMDFSAKDGFIGKEYYKNKSASWENKYVYPLKKTGNWWYFGLYKPTYKERFLFSSTIFVFLTDYWHFQQFLFLNSVTMACALIQWDWVQSIVTWILMQIMYIVGFNTSFERKRI